MKRSFVTLKALIGILFSATLLFFYKGYSFGTVNHPILIPSILNLADPLFLKGDWYISALLPYHYLFKIVYADLLPYMSLQSLFFISYLITLVIYMGGIFRLSKALFKTDKAFYYIVPFALLWKIPGIEPDFLFHSNTFEGSLLANAMALWAFACFFEMKYVRACIIAGIITAVHIVIGINVALTLLCSAAVLWIVSKSPSISRMIASGIAFLLTAALPILITFKTAINGADTGDGISFIEYLRFRAPHHFILSSWRGTIAEFGIICVLGLLVILFNGEKRSKQTASATVVAVILAGVAAQFVVSEIVPIDFFIRFHYYRMTIFISTLIYLTAGYYCFRRVERNPSIGIYVYVLLFLFSLSPLSGLILMIALIVTDTAISATFRNILRIVLYAIPAVIVLGMLINKEGALYALERFNVRGYVLLCAMIVTTVGVIGLAIVKRLRIQHTVIPVFLISAVVGITQFVQGPLYNVRMDLTPEKSWHELCFWIRENTPENAAFIVPPHLAGFMLYAERREFVDFKTNPFVMSGVKEWKTRIEALTGIENIFDLKQKGWNALPVLKQRYLQISEKNVLSLAKRYNMDYIIVQKPARLSFDTVYKTDKFILYKIPL